jgi:hypothetical protein
MRLLPDFVLSVGGIKDMANESKRVKSEAGKAMRSKSKITRSLAGEVLRQAQKKRRGKRATKR